MKNKEKFAKEIVDISLNNNTVAVKMNGEITCCALVQCMRCLFNQKDRSCYELRKEWAEAEYAEPKVFTEEEKAILRALPKANWVARDMNGFVRIYQIAPYKRKFGWVSDGQNFNAKAFSNCEFSAVKWEDEEPTSREEILK